jgi:hypothetical protein
MEKAEAKKGFRFFDEKEREIMIKTHIALLETIKEEGINTFSEAIAMIAAHAVLLDGLHREILEEDKNNIEK